MPAPRRDRVNTGASRNQQHLPDDEAGERADRQAELAQPDPMKTAFGYIGADSFTRQRQGQGPGQRRGQGGGGSQGRSGGGGRRGGRGR
jgi:23S rRNA pseudouridine2605 synthase